jgi:hypothetical protein
MICCVHACTGTNTANLSKPTACMNRSITSTLPRTWQDINKSFDPTVTSNWWLSSIYRYNSESRPSHPPLPSQPSSFHWMKVMTKLHCSMNFNWSNISKGESFSSCTRPKINHDMLWNKVTATGSLASLSMICLADKILCQLAVAFFCFAAVLSTCCCARHVKEDDRVFQLFVLQRDKW